jgi:hypothetical protein
MTKKQFARDVIGCSYSLWRFALLGQRNLGYPKAKIAATVLNTGIDVWLDEEKADERQRAWDQYQGSVN